ncbi:MAG: radical SAM protein [Elusimicrobia bacterium]|nr:radical SAM protein [Elusimicrobiota bacterium]
MSLHLPVNADCNLDCVFCSAADRGGDFSLPALLELIDGDESGQVQVSGGEPLLRQPPDLLRILLHCRKRRKKVEFQTNGVLVPAYELKALRMIVKLSDLVNVNFPAHTPELDRAATRRRGCLRPRVRGVRRLLELGARVRLTHVVHRGNYAHCRAFVDFVHERLPGVERIQFSYVKACGRARESLRVVPRFRDAAPHLNSALARCRRLKLRFDVDHIPLCFVREFQREHVDCRKLRQGRPEPLAEKARVPACRGCRLRALCPGPRRDYIRIYKTL